MLSSLASYLLGGGAASAEPRCPAEAEAPPAASLSAVDADDGWVLVDSLESGCDNNGFTDVRLVAVASPPPPPPAPAPRANPRAAAAAPAGGNGGGGALRVQEQQVLQLKAAQKVQQRRASQNLKRGPLERHNKARECNARNKVLRRSDRMLQHSGANNNRKC